MTRNNPEYKDGAVQISEANLSQLPEDGNIMDQLPVRILSDEQDVDDDISDEDLEAAMAQEDASAVPDLLPDTTEVAQIRQTVVSAEALNAAAAAPTFQSTPVDELDNTRLWAGAFPTLLPFGNGDPAQLRPRTATVLECIQHALKWHDGRFAAHPRFAFVVFNKLMRRRIRDNSAFYVRRQQRPPPGHEAPAPHYTVDELRDLLTSDDPAKKADADALVQNLVRNGHKLAGSRPYWRLKGGQLDSIIDALLTPTLFATFSHADLHWDDQMRHLPGYEIWLAEQDPAEKTKLARAILHKNPHVAAYWVYTRFHIFMNTVSKPKFRVEDHWNRWEWQARGGGHNHGLYWVKRALLPYLDLESEASRAAFSRFFGYHITAINPSPPPAAGGKEEEERPPSTDNTCLAAGPQLPPTWGAVTALLLRVHVHVCRLTRCLRDKKDAAAPRPQDITPEVVAATRDINRLFVEAHRDVAAGFPSRAVETLNKAGRKLADFQCRFYFPCALCATPHIAKALNPNHHAFLPARNDTRLNQYNPLLLFAWKANLDVSVCLDYIAVKTYVAKFASKAEHKSKSYKQLVADVAPHISSSGNPLLSLVVRVMNKLLAERDWSRQEVMHHLLGLHLVDASRTVVPVDCRPEAEQGQRFQAPPGDGADVVEARNLVHKYMTPPRHQDLDALSFFRWATLHNHRDHSVRPRAKPAVLSYFPKYTRGTEDFARVKMMLHHPFRDDVADVLHWDSHPHATYLDAYQACEATCGHDDYDYYGVEMAPPRHEDQEGEGEDEFQDGEAGDAGAGF